MWEANHQVSWGRGLGEQEGGGLHVEAFCVLCVCDPVNRWLVCELVTGYSDQVGIINEVLVTGHS